MKMDITLVVPGLPFDGDSLNTHSLGGSESAGAYMARELGALGHKVTVFSGIPAPKKFGDVVYRPIEGYENWVQHCPQDVVVIQRNPLAFSKPTAAKLNIAWCHDLAQRRFADQFKAPLWNIDAYFLVSQFMVDQYVSATDLDPSLLWATRNGIDAKLIESIGTPERDPFRLFYSSRPERGLDVLLRDIFPRVLEAEPRATLAVAGYHNPIEQYADMYADLEGVMDQYGDRVIRLGHLSKPELYAQMKAASIYAYPTPSPVMPKFAEVSCISVMEANACGLNIVTSDRGALRETTRDYAQLIEGRPGSPEYAEAFTKAILSACKVRPARPIEGNDWSSIAKEWSEKFHHMIAERNDDPRRLAYHFYRHSELGLAKTLLADEGFEPNDNPTMDEMDARYAFTETAGAFKAHYERMSIEDTNIWLQERVDNGFISPEMFATNPEARFHAIEDSIKREIEKRQQSTEVDELEGNATVFDYGCGHGWMGCYLRTKLPIEVIGYDLDNHARKWARQFAAMPYSGPGSFTVIENNDLSTGCDDDIGVCSEVLEHVLSPADTMMEVEAAVRLGGLIILTVPFGPWEYKSPNWDRFRNHIREYEAWDLREIFDGKPELQMMSVRTSTHPVTQEPLGFYFVTYRCDRRRIKERDNARKLFLQRPKQTVSANMIAGPGCEDTLRWSLKSVVDFVDEIVIADCGLSDEAKRIVAAYPHARLVPAPSPLDEGFETPRNIALEASGMDWVLWLDTDERLIGGDAMQRYLRANYFDGYSIRQHHFTVDADFPPDMPVRLFRRLGPDGQPRCRFYGVVHEHPETALNKGPGNVCVLPDVSIAHVGYLSEGIRQARFTRNLPLLNRDAAKYPERILTKFFLMRDYLQIAKYTLLQNGGQRSAEIDANCRRVVELHKENFVGKELYFGLDPAKYCSDALMILGEGIDAEIAIKIGRDGKSENMAGSSRRFCSVEDIQIDLKKRLDEKASQFEHEWW